MSVVWIHKICIWETQDLESASRNTGSAFWKHKICDLYSGHARSAFWKHKICSLRSQDKDLMDHTSQEWLNGVQLFIFPQNHLFYENIIFCMILVRSQDKDSMNHTSQEWLNGVHLSSFQQKSNIFYENIRKLRFFCKIPPSSLPPSLRPGGRRRRRRRRRKNSPRCPGPCPIAPRDEISS